MAGITMTQFATQAARDLGCIRSGQSLSTDILHDILDAANQMLDSWLIDDLKVPASEAAVYNLTPGTQIYTIGPNETSPNFTAPRPTEITVANIILATINPVLRTPLEIINVEQWAAIPISAGTNPLAPNVGLPQTLPTRLYYIKDFNTTTGSATICLWGGDINADQLELFTPDQTVLAQFPNLSTAYIYPPGYQRMIRKSLAVEIAPLMTMYCKSARAEHVMAPSPVMLQIVQQQADEARRIVEGYNSPEPILTGDPAFLGQSARRGWNYLLGTNGRTGR